MGDNRFPNSFSRLLNSRAASIFRRPVYIFWLSLLAITFFALTFGLNRLYAQKQQQLSRYWYGRAQAALESHQADEAISDLRTALVYSHDRPQYLFSLAQALEAAGRITEARSYLLSLLEDEPGNGPYNLQLARLAAKENDVSHAMRYFNGAIYGAWESDPISKRQQARQELVSYLLEKGMNTQARGELLTFTTDMPKTAQSEFWVANAFSRLGDDSSALQFYKAGLRLDRRNAGAMLGAGESSFRLLRYHEALNYFKAALALRPDATTSGWLQLTSMTMDLNPFQSQMSAVERRHRLILAMDIADQRLRACTQLQNGSSANSPSTSQSLRAQWIQLDDQLQNARSDSDVVQLLAPAANLIVNIEKQNRCSAPAVGDQALLQIYANAEELQP